MDELLLQMYLKAKTPEELAFYIKLEEEIKLLHAEFADEQQALERELEYSGTTVFSLREDVKELEEKILSYEDLLERIRLLAQGPDS